MILTSGTAVPSNLRGMKAVDGRKYCPRCKLEKRIEEFRKNAKRPDGLYVYCKQCQSDMSKQYYRTHSEHSQTVIARTAQKRKNNPEYGRTLTINRYRARLALPLEDRIISIAYKQAIKNDPCFYCGQRTEAMHDDHRFPLSKGGTDHWWNIVRACSVCNLAKGARCEDHFRSNSVCDCSITVPAMI